MKIKLGIIILFFMAVSGYGQSSYPTYKEVVTELFHRYHADSINQSKAVLLEKRQMGWKVTTIDPQSNDTISELFWDSQKKRYNPIHLPKKRTDEIDEEAVSNFINSSSAARFNSLLYYGYVGWDQDLIKLYENKTPLTANEWYALGYAYSNYANGLLNDNFDFTDNKTKFNLPISKNSMTDSQLQTYLSFEKKAINCYLELYKKNPEFQTLPGQIGIKYFNELASNFLNLRIYQNEEIAMQHLQGINVYSDNYKLYAKYMLDSCDKNAILFTVGDNDTFPLLTYQVQNNYRKDVLIVNTSLLQDERYVLMMHNRILDSEGIPLSLNADFIKDDLSEAILFTATTENPVSIENLSTLLSDDKNLIETQIRNYKTLPSKNFSFGSGKQKMEWRIENQALYRSDLIILDIIASNNWKRPIYFADNNSEEGYLGLSPYLQFEGLVYKLGSTKGTHPNSEIGYVNITKTEENCAKMFHFKNKINLPVEERQVAMNYRSIYGRLAAGYIQKGQLEKAKATLDKGLMLYPNDLSYFSFDVLMILENYYELKSLDKVNQIENQILQNLKNRFDNYCFLSDSERDHKYELLKSQLGYLKSNYTQK